MDRDQQRHQRKWEVATELAVRAGDLERCKICGEAFQKSGSSEETVALAETLLQEGDELEMLFEDEYDARVVIEEVVDEAPETCSCEGSSKPS